MACTSKLLKEEIVLDILNESDEYVIITYTLTLLLVTAVMIKMTLQLLRLLLMKRIAR
jgi:hypothetical protein